MLEKPLLIDGIEFLLTYYGKELLDKAVKGRVLAFRVIYTPNRYETESQPQHYLSDLKMLLQMKFTRSLARIRNGMNVLN